MGVFASLVTIPDVFASLVTMMGSICPKCGTPGDAKTLGDAKW
jgi:hypothetical protein